MYLCGLNLITKLWKIKFHSQTILYITREHLLHGYILGVLTQTTAWDQLWGGDVFLRLYICSLALPRVTAVWQGLWNSDHVVLKSIIRSSASACSVAVWQSFWKSDHVVLKSIIRTLASPWQQQSHWALMMTQDAYFSFLTYAKQLLLVTFCETTAGNRKKWKCDVRTDGRTDRRELK